MHISFQVQDRLRQALNDSEATRELIEILEDVPAGGAASLPTVTTRPAIDNAIDLEPLMAYLEAGYRPEYNPAGLSSTIHVGDWTVAPATGGVGSDITGDGSNGAPFATIDKVLQLVGRTNPAEVKVLLSPEVHDLPPAIIDNNWITYEGFAEDGDVGTQTGAAIQVDEEAIIVDVTGPFSVAIDDLAGTLIEWTSGAANGKRGWIRRNGATGGGVTEMTLTQNNPTAINIPVDTDTFKVINLLSTVRITSFFYLFVGSVQCNFKTVVISETSPGFVMFPTATDKIGITDCRIDIGRIQVGRHGGCELFNSYLAPTGNPNRGGLTIRRGGDFQLLRGSVVDFDLRATSDANRFVELDNGATFSFDGNVVFRGLNTNGIQCDGAGIGAQDPMDSHFVWVFDDCDGPAVKINGKGLGLAGSYQLPNLHGEVASTFGVEAEGCACVRAGGPGAGANSLRTASGGGPLNNASADGGVTASAQSSDTTVIVNMVPALIGFRKNADDIRNETTGTHVVTATENGTLLVGNATGGVVDFDLPTAVGNGGLRLSSVKADVTANAVNLNGDGAETINGSNTHVLAAQYDAVTIVADGLGGWFIEK